ncbi:Creatinase/aminopeptidase [Rozella allomycis CSF55]|uniref:Creatinase/aminopeptidase n=1 Tax=Rozella allomycis (strain CSF55) TaxID=988480 RepID=A0A4P9YP76_ROZAC|nr:Creatinase/aminopeptidase [Rozella allomycis CSF55]
MISKKIPFSIPIRLFSQTASKPPLSTLSIPIPPEELSSRRYRLTRHLDQNSIILLSGHKMFYKSPHIFYPFRQQSDFYYLTGFNEPNAAMILKRDDSVRKGYQMILFVEPYDAHKVMWEGPMCGTDGAVRSFMADQAHPIGSLGAYLMNNIQKYDKVYKPDSMQLPSVKGVEMKSAHDLLDMQRVVKSEFEIDLMTKACSISAKAMKQAIKFTQPGMFERALEAKLEYEAKIRGANGLAYVPVCAGGENANTIHYVSNAQQLRDGDLVLVDAGSDYEHYCGDITRTWPVNGTYSRAQMELYNAVLYVQKKIIEKCKETSGVSINQLYDYSRDYLWEALMKLDIKIPHYEIPDVYPHDIGHYLGLDVHDCVTASKEMPLKAGMVVTVEPGLYVRKNDTRFPEKYRGIGIRIEDDILVGPNFCTNLTEEVPKEVDEIEALFPHFK